MKTSKFPALQSHARCSSLDMIFYLPVPVRVAK